MPLDVRLNLVISDILSIDDMEAEMLVYIRQTWYDYRLTWNSTEILKIREHFLDKIWLPDVRISNMKTAKRFEGFGGTNMNIHPNGKVYYSQLWVIYTRLNKFSWLCVFLAVSLRKIKPPLNFSLDSGFPRALLCTPTPNHCV